MGFKVQNAMGLLQCVSVLALGVDIEFIIITPNSWLGPQCHGFCLATPKLGLHCMVRKGES